MDALPFDKFNMLVYGFQLLDNPDELEERNKKYQVIQSKEQLLMQSLNFRRE